jgi:hypothetical protein
MTLFYRNPIRAPSGALRGQHGALSYFARLVPSGSSSVTGSYTLLDSTQINITAKRQLICYPFVLTVKHSVANATYGLYLSVQRGDSPALPAAADFAEFLGFPTLPVADQWFAVNGTFLQIPSIPSAGSVPGTGRMTAALYLLNQTAGTLSWVEPSNTDKWSAFSMALFPTFFA